MKRSLQHIVALGILLALGPAFLAVGCAPPNWGECSDDEDLREPGNYVANAICKDGKPACADGSPLCLFFETGEKGSVLVEGCGEERCLECPEGMLICLMPHLEGTTEDTYKTCVLEKDDCWAGDTYKPSVF